MNYISFPKVVVSFILISFLFQVACDEQTFNTIPNEKCFEANSVKDLSGEFTEEGTCIYKHNLRVGKIDILFVIDNSKSMYKEQQKIADRFPTFINTIWPMDFQIGIMTTDITKDPVRSGQFLTLSNGKKILSNNEGLSINEVNQIFSSSVTRDETLSCDNFRDACPSGDVRGIYAANLAITKNPSFFRPDAHTAIVVLSDADERVFGGFRTGFELDPNWDTPESLVNKIINLDRSKTVSVHSIIINPGHPTLPDHLKTTFELSKDIECLNQQDNEGDGVRGFYGTQYYALSNPSEELKSSGNLLKGTVGSICASDYGRELSNISSNVKNNVKTIGLRCNPIRLDVYETGNPDNKIPYTLEKANQVKLDGFVPVGLKVTVEAECENRH